jgi:beta-RFAP synthase
LHFGLLNPGEAGGSALSRRFGGVGLMVERPGLRLSVEASASWSVAGPLGERAMAFAHRCAEDIRRERADIDLSPRRLAVEWAAPEHVGLGTGTQLGLAVARALAVSWGVEADVPTLARWVGRGLRSALGAHGFERGGFLVEAGKQAADGLAPLIARLPFPDEWRVVLALPRVEDRPAGWHGLREAEAFAQLAARPAEPGRIDVLCRLVLLGLLPALAERDVNAFGEALYEFNVRVGEAFAPVQGGVYAGTDVAERVAFVRGQGVRGAGQSSWGPAVFAVVADADQAEHLSARLRDRFVPEDAAVLVTRACNHGATLEREKQN